MKKPKKSLGQNFLNSQGALKAMLEAGKITEQDLILEIGPGLGALTNLLLKTKAKIIAIEKDEELCEILRQKFESEINSNQLKLINGDIRDFDFSEIKKEYKVIANIPYYITGEIIRLILTNSNQPKLAVLLVQKEVAERIVSKDGKESLLSISVKIFGQPKIVKKVKAGSFFPKPKVDSAILLIEQINKNKLPEKKEEEFFKIVRTAFQSKRKTLGHSLKKLFSKNQLEENKINPKIRPEKMKMEDWLRLLDQIKN